MENHNEKEIYGIIQLTKYDKKIINDVRSTKEISLDIIKKRNKYIKKLRLNGLK